MKLSNFISSTMTIFGLVMIGSFVTAIIISDDPSCPPEFLNLLTVSFLISAAITVVCLGLKILEKIWKLLTYDVRISKKAVTGATIATLAYNASKKKGKKERK